MVPQPARADVTAKLASSAALRDVKLSRKKLDSLETYVSNQDYMGFKQALRVEPFSTLRKSCTVLVRGGEDGPEAQHLQKLYQTFIRQLENVDSTASLAMRGRGISTDELEKELQQTSDALSDFIQAAEHAAAGPVQYAEETTS